MTFSLLVPSLNYGEGLLDGFCVSWMLLVSVMALKFRGSTLSPHQHPHSSLPLFAQQNHYSEPQAAPVLANSVSLAFLFLLSPPWLLIPAVKATPGLVW